jgi:hypothetical protein
MEKQNGKLSPDSRTAGKVFACCYQKLPAAFFEFSDTDRTFARPAVIVISISFL